MVYPERETGIRVAHSFAAAGVHDYLDVAPGYGLARMQLPDTQAGKRLGELGLHTAYGVTALALCRRGAVSLNPGESEVLRQGDELIVGGPDEALEQLPSAVGDKTEAGTATRENHKTG